MRTCAPWASAAALAALLAAGIAPLLPLAAQEDPGGSRAADLTQRTVALRTALHHDATLVAPFDELLRQFREAGQADELLRIYATHVAQYPQDPSGAAVHLRLLLALHDSSAVTHAKAAAATHAQSGYLQFLLYRALDEAQAPGAVEALDRAIDLAERPQDREDWTRLLLPRAIAEGKRSLAEARLRSLAQSADGSAAARLRLARAMVESGFAPLALETARGALAAGPDPETMVDLELLAAQAEVALERSPDAARRLDALLEKVTPDSWKRPEVVRRRIVLARSDAEREALVTAARRRLEARPQDEGAALDFAELLAGFERRRESLEVLQAALGRLPGSARLEKATFELLDRLRDEKAREAFLAARLAASPDRRDLRRQRAQALYLLGRSAEGRAELDRLLGDLAPPARIDLLLEVARALRSQSRLRDAAALLEEVLQKAPARLDVRRELAECLLVRGAGEEAKRKARIALGREIPADATLEDLLDLGQFLVEHEFYPEALRALEPRVALDQASIELRLMVLQVHGRKGDRAAGEALLASARGLADTPARYRLWLEGAASFYESLDREGSGLPEFLAEERSRLEGEAREWTPERLERRLAFADVAGRGKEAEQARAFLQTELEGNAPPSARAALRRKLLESLEKDPAASERVTQELEKLLEDDPRSQAETRARLALAHARADRRDLAAAILRSLDLEAIEDPVVLTGLRTFYDEEKDLPRQLRILERLVALNPTSRAAWQDFAAALAQAGEEGRLRAALRKVLAGVEKMAITEGTRQALQGYVVDSVWRSAAAGFARGDRQSLESALAALATVEGAARGSEETLWINWARAVALEHLGRSAERDEALAELDRLIGGPATASATAAVPVPESEGKEGNDGTPAPSKAREIVFPDGLRVPFDAARALLHAGEAPRAPPLATVPTTGATPATPSATPSTAAAGETLLPGPDGLRVRWVFETTDRSPITGILAAGKERLVVSDRQGAVYWLDRWSGKLLRSVESALPAAMPGRTQVQYQVNNTWFADEIEMRAPIPVVDSSGRLFAPSAQGVRCLAPDGAVAWTAELEPSPASTAAASSRFLSVSQGLSFGSNQMMMTSSAPQIPALVFLDGPRLLTFQPATGTAAAFDGRSGKLLWQWQLPAIPNGAGGPGEGFTSGATASGGRFFVYASTAALLDAATGSVIWNLDPARARTFPFRLEDPESGPAPPVPAPPALDFSSFSMRRGRVRRPSGGAGAGASPGTVFIDRAPRSLAPQPALASTETFALSSSAVRWVASPFSSRSASLDGGILFLDSYREGIAVGVDLPVGGRVVETNGRWLGLIGGWATVVYAEEIDFVDPTSGARWRFAIGDVVNPEAPEVLGVTASGPIIYLAGARGLLALNPASRQRLFTAAWPEGLAPSAPAAEANPGLSPQQMRLYRRGRSLAEVKGPLLPCLAQEGTLYAVGEPWRLAALSAGGAGDGR